VADNSTTNTNYLPLFTTASGSSQTVSTDTGFTYNPKFWQPVVPTIVEKYQLDNSSNVLDVGCAKGFFLHDLKYY
jgi:hypothetical protein